MRRFLSALVLIASVVFVTACASGRAPDVSVAAVQQFVTSKSATIIDVNDEETRTTKGIVPGATKLSSYDKFAMTELPADKNATLVFYCYNTLCPASGLAADRAIDAGYKDVRVMKAGIIGWKDAQEKASAKAKS